ncbi:single-stranded DNA-binding protein [Amycolatopsis sp. cg5]|uniref:single-stranded DNA-binding protein n=1 Tax=Amycolatopsis sp. cg5 TaxID=3238802 RepID=UPI003525700F
MAIGETTVTVVGNVVSDLVRQTRDGRDVVSFWMRSKERRRDRESGLWVDGRTLSVRVVCWRRLGESVFSSISRGDPVIVTGRMSNGGAGDGGEPSAIPELEASVVAPDLNRCTAVLTRRTPPRPAEQPEFLDWRPAAAPRKENPLVRMGTRVTAASP